jgi:hypothetical protein
MDGREVLLADRESALEVLACLGAAVERLQRDRDRGGRGAAT